MQAGAEQSDDWPALLDAHVRERAWFYQRLAFGVLRNATDADDVCQRAYLRAWEYRESIRLPEAIGKWLTRVVANESFLHLRRERVEQKTRDQCCRPSESTQPDADFERRELILMALAKLPESLREIVVLRTMQGMSGNEVSRLLEISPSDVSRRLHAGLDHLRQIIENGHTPSGG